MVARTTVARNGLGRSPLKGDGEPAPGTLRRFRCAPPARFRQVIRPFHRSAMTTLFSYVVDHDTGFAPNPYGGFCTLVHCKHGARSGRRNVVELAQRGDWIIGTGGQSKKSCGNGRVVYIMRVDDQIPFRDYLRDARFHGRADRKDRGGGNKYALISKMFFYFGRNAIHVSDIPTANLDHPIEKKGPGFRKDFPESFIRQFAAWVQGGQGQA